MITTCQVTLSDQVSYRLSDEADGKSAYDDGFTRWLEECSSSDEETGSVDEPGGHVARYGKNILHTDEYGFVTRVKCASLTQAKRMFDIVVKENGPTTRYYYDEATGMEHTHDGENTRESWHDGVGQVTRHDQTEAEFVAMFPDAHITEY